MPNPNEPWLDILIQNNATVTGSGQTINYYVDGRTHIELLISVGNKVGNPILKYCINVVEPSNNKMIMCYEAVLDQNSQTNSIVIKEEDVSGTYINISWFGMLNVNNYFTNVYSRLVVK